MVIKDSLLEYCDATGHLSVSQRNKYLASIGVVRIHESGEILLKQKYMQKVNGKTGWDKVNEDINNVLKDKKDEKTGTMGVEIIKDLANEEINPDDIDF